MTGKRAVAGEKCLDDIHVQGKSGLVPHSLDRLGGFV